MDSDPQSVFSLREGLESDVLGTTVLTDCLILPLKLYLMDAMSRDSGEHSSLVEGETSFSRRWKIGKKAT